MTKKLDTSGIQNELRGASVFFPNQTLVEEIIVEEKQDDHQKLQVLESESDIMVSGYQSALVEKIRKVVKVIGKETTPLRMTPQEKEQLSDIVYSFKKKGIKTSENEINRIGSAYLILDYKTNKENSLLERVLEALNS